MDKQLALMKRYQKDENTIAYVHNGEIVLIKRENGTLFELIIAPETESTVSSRTLSSAEMTLQQFAKMSEIDRALAISLGINNISEENYERQRFY